MRLLVAEDDPNIRSFIARGLREASYAVDLAVDGEQALYMASISDYDVIILDVMMPEIDGYTVCRQLRQDGVTVPIMMLTARDATDDRVKGLDEGADDYLIKPFAFDELLARLRALLRRRPNLGSSKIVIADLEIDTIGRRVWRCGTEIGLTSKEYALLEFLAREKGRVVGRAEIAEHVWDEQFDPFSNLIDVYVKRLRAKMDDHRFPLNLIRTRRGAGYILDDSES